MKKYPFTLPELPYATNALEPVIDQKTMEIHHGKHHQAYVNNLNAALEKYPEFHEVGLKQLLTSLDKLPKEIQTAVRNNGGGTYNHKLFWKMMAAPNTTQASDELLKAIKTAFGSLAGFKEAFAKQAMTRFGSGWAWLVKDADNNLKVLSTANQDSPLELGYTPLLTLDVWEHAYYLNYQNRRADYVEKWFDVVNWNYVSEKFAK